MSDENEEAIPNYRPLTTKERNHGRSARETLKADLEEEPIPETEPSETNDVPQKKLSDARKLALDALRRLRGEDL